MKKVIQTIMFLIGAYIGTLIFIGCTKLIDTDYWIGTKLTESQEIGMAVFFAVVFGFLFSRIVPAYMENGKNLLRYTMNKIKGISPNKLFFGTIGLILGFLISFLLSFVYIQIKIYMVSIVLTALTYLVLGYLGVIVLTEKGAEILNHLLSEKVFGKNSLKNKKIYSQSKILDTSVIIDGRILEIMDTGFLEGEIVVPEFVLLELQQIADSKDSLKRKRGRRGLDILKAMQDKYGIEIYNTKSEKNVNDIPEVDIKLLKLAQIIKGKVVTNDFNLNKVAKLKKIDILNVNELANSVKPAILPEEIIRVKLVKEGQERNQALAYLDDGTMIVIEEGRNHIGEEIQIRVSKVLQTPAGKMIFGRPINDK